MLTIGIKLDTVSIFVDRTSLG